MSAARATAAQLADALGISSRAVHLRAQAEGWAYTEESGRGGMRRLYMVDSLPALWRAKLLWAQPAPADATRETLAAGAAGRAEAARVALRTGLEGKAAQTRRQAALRQAGELAAAGQARMDARLAVVRACELFAAGPGAGLPAMQARLLFCQHYNAATLGQLEVTPAVRAAVPRTSDSSIERWQRDIRTRGITALAGAYGNRAGAGKVDSTPELRQFVQAMLVAHPHVRATQVMAGLRARFTEQRDDLPSLRALERWVTAWRRDNAEIISALGNPDGWRNKYLTAFGSRSEGVVRLNQRWELDSSPADVMCSDGRYALIGGIDVYSRRARLLVAKTSRATAVAALTRRMLLDLGVPEECKTDNGTDYTSAHVVRVFGGLDITHTLCPPYSPDHKPHIERFFGSFHRDLAELLPGYIGHNVAERKAIEGRASFAERRQMGPAARAEEAQVRCTGAELQAFCDQWIDTVYEHAPHGGLNQRTPFEMAAAWSEPVRRITDERALDVLLADAPDGAGLRTVQKKGIKVDDAWFIAPELHNWVGERVHVRYDPIDHDLGRLYVFGHVAGQGDDQFVCTAECPERTGMDRREVAAKARALQREHIQAGRKALRREAKRINTDSVVGEVLRDRAAASGKLALLPKPTETHTSTGLAAAVHAARIGTATQRTTADIEHLADVQAARARIAAEQVPKGLASAAADPRGPQPMPVFETVGERVGWLFRQAAVRPLSNEEQDTLAQYRRAQPRSYRRLEETAAAEITEHEKPATDRIAGDSAAV